jgi:hypothetical protein
MIVSLIQIIFILHQQENKTRLMYELSYYKIRVKSRQRPSLIVAPIHVLFIMILYDRKVFASNP